MNSTKKTTALIYNTHLCFIVFSSMQMVYANPIDIPFYGSLQFGNTSLNNNIRHIESLVELDVYDTLTYGN